MIFADVALQVRPLPGYCIDSTEGDVWFVVPTGDGARASMSLMLTPRMIAEVAMILMRGDAAPPPCEYGMSWVFEATTPLGLRAVLTEE